MQLYKNSDRSKLFSIIGLFIMASLILVSGVVFSIYSLVAHVQFLVMTTEVPGIVFGLVISFLGFRYMVSVMRLKSELTTTDAKFSWSNFKKSKKKS